MDYSKGRVARLKHLEKQLRLVKCEQNETARRVASLQAVIEFLEISGTAFLDEALTWPLRRLQTELLDKLEPKNPKGGRPRLPQGDVSHRAAAIACVDLLRRNEINPRDARDFVARELSRAGTPSTPKELERWEHRWIADQIQPGQATEYGPSPEEIRRDILDQMCWDVEQGIDPREVAREVILRSSVLKTS